MKLCVKLYMDPECCGQPTLETIENKIFSIKFLSYNLALKRLSQT